MICFVMPICLALSYFILLDLRIGGSTIEYEIDGKLGVVGALMGKVQ